MKHPNRNPHTFDMSSYYSGLTFAVGGRDFDKEDKETVQKEASQDKRPAPELDWSFLKSKSRRSMKQS